MIERREGQELQGQQEQQSLQIEIDPSPETNVLDNNCADQPIVEEGFPELEIDEDDAIAFPEEAPDFPYEDETMDCEENDTLRQLMIIERFKCNQGTAVLKYLCNRYPADRYPVHWGALFKTPRDKIQATPIDGGEYFHYGIEAGLQMYNPKVFRGMTMLCIDIGIDGFLLAASSSQVGWLIMGAIVDVRLIPFLIGMYCGKHSVKSIDAFMKPFCEDAGNLMKNGVQLIKNGPRVPFRIRLFCCDTPARSMITNTKYYSAKAGCHKCNQRSYHRGYLNFFQTYKGDPRTDILFGLKVDTDHHKSLITSELEKLGIGMVSQFPYEVMHLIDLGVTKSVLSAIVDKTTVKKNSIDVDGMCLKYESYKTFCPRDFARKPRNLVLAKKFKATEFRQFVLYTGVVLLKEYLPIDMYTHFLTLSLAYRIVHSDCGDDALAMAEYLFQAFVYDYKMFYPKGGLGYNVHGLLHVVDDVKLYGCVDSYSAYKFENCIQLLGNTIRKSHQVLQQVYNRILEKNAANCKADIQPYDVMDIKNKDLCLLNDRKTYVKVESVSNESVITALPFLESVDFFTSPLESREMLIAKCVRTTDGILLGPPITMKISDIYRRCYALPFNDDIVLIPIL